MTIPYVITIHEWLHGFLLLKSQGLEPACIVNRCTSTRKVTNKQKGKLHIHVIIVTIIVNAN